MRHVRLRWLLSLDKWVPWRLRPQWLDVEQISSSVRVWLNSVVWSLSVPNVWKVSVLTYKFVAVLDVRVTLVCLNSLYPLKMMWLKNTVHLGFTVLTKNTPLVITSSQKNWQVVSIVNWLKKPKKLVKVPVVPHVVRLLNLQKVWTSNVRWFMHNVTASSITIKVWTLLSTRFLMTLLTRLWLRKISQKRKIFTTLSCGISASASMKFLRIWTSTIVRKSWNSSTSLLIVNLMLRSRSWKPRNLTSISNAYPCLRLWMTTGWSR